ncbi:MAG: hypothetical protein N7Q72_06185, partial [Spiroplasma sp. Tabriz.8]|nr:hypothetical protein [Spiroplasma sp. Tabriz.8]
IGNLMRASALPKSAWSSWEFKSSLPSIYISSYNIYRYIYIYIYIYKERLTMMQKKIMNF